jgi:uncharacterized protein YodC (DUF2158 family)
MSLHHMTISTDDLVLVFSAESFRNPHEPPLYTGNFVRLNSGGPRYLIVDKSGDTVTVAWRDGAGIVHERDFPEACVHRIA